MAFLLVILSCLLACSAELADEMQVYEKECLGVDKMACMDGGCIWRNQFCDGHIDCKDSSDEELCLHKPQQRVICNSTHQFLCEDRQRCIPSTWMCNNQTDCEDGSDELNCSQDQDPSKCKGFTCDNGHCISSLWQCEGNYDCEDKTDEDPYLCRHTIAVPKMDRTVCLTGTDYDFHHEFSDGLYKCLDGTFCLAKSRMCDGMQDCRDHSDEGPFCANWTTQCNNFTCHGESRCLPGREGPWCDCNNTHKYNYTTKTCDTVNQCELAAPRCGQICEDRGGPYFCRCEEGYLHDSLNLSFICHAPDPEALLFFSTRSDIRYLKLKTNQFITVATGLKQAHGVAYDGKNMYWVESALGHQAIMRAHLENMEDTKEVLVSIGLEDAGDVAIDWLGGNIFFSDSERGIISACRTDGSFCTTLKTEAKVPKFVTLDARNGAMYWADWHGKPVIMSARMDGSRAEVLVDTLDTFPTGLTVDVTNGRLYFVDRTVKGVKIDSKLIFDLFRNYFHNPYSIAVFENRVFWSDWTTNTIQSVDKLTGQPQTNSETHKLDTPVYGMHVYHPILMNTTGNPCQNNNCSHFCFVTSNVSYVCGCPDGMKLVTPNCKPIATYRPQYLLVGAGARFTRIEYNALGNPETHATHFDIGILQAMAYDSSRDTLYIYDSERRTISYMNMTDFSLGMTHLLLYTGLDNVVDMEYDYVTDNLYFLNAGRRLLEVLSLRTLKRAIVHYFDGEVPLSFCLIPDYGKVLVAVWETDSMEGIHIDSFGLDGSERTHIVMNDLKGPHIRLQYNQNLDNVYIADDGNSIIDFMHPEGTGRENYRELSTTMFSLAVTDSYIFWTDRRTTRLYWSDVHETTPKIRRLDLTVFPNDTRLHLKAMLPAPAHVNHPCQANPCSDICVQTPHAVHRTTKYKCLCPPGLLNVDDKCVPLMNCEESQMFCHNSNKCIDKSAKCNNVRDCEHGEDEEDCPSPSKCTSKQIICNGICIDRSLGCIPITTTPSAPPECNPDEFECVDEKICIERSQVCNGVTDCPGGSDEEKGFCNTLNCLHTEFMCSSGSCILAGFRCDGEPDCVDGSDEVGCVNKTCAQGYYQCRNRQCVDLQKRCDRNYDCADASDEKGCVESDIVDLVVPANVCPQWEYACELNRSICIPITARCNAVVDCPGGTDEEGCIFAKSCPSGVVCESTTRCVYRWLVCDGKKDCVDGSDETPDACSKVNRTSSLYQPIVFPKTECYEGYVCDNGQCLEWRDVCNNKTQCYDTSDEGGLCSVSCENNKCAQFCEQTPRGPQCRCSPGLRPGANKHTCVDVDECEHDVCSQRCRNVPGSFLCSCHPGYALRSDRRSCKATKGGMSVLYVSGNSVRSITADGIIAVEYNDPSVARITDMDYDVRKKKLYVSAADSGKLIEVNSTHDHTVITNIGRPTRVAVDWVTGNVYFVDNSPAASYVKVCNVEKKRCAKLQKLPGKSDVTAFIVDPIARRMFYCVTKDLESVVWSARLTGQRARDLAAVHNCTGLAADTFKKTLYVAETGPSYVIQMDYHGDNVKTLLKNDPHLEAPHDLAIFEDHIYFLVANSYKLSRCKLYGQKTCELYLQRVFDANTFAIRHESTQRGDVSNVCAGLACDNVCVPDEWGPVCVCDSGLVSKQDGRCPLVAKNELPLFNGWTFQEFMKANKVSFTLIFGILGLILTYLCVFFYYRYTYRKRRQLTYAPVHFQNTLAEGMEGVSPLSSPVTLVPPEPTLRRHEYVNPMEYLRERWQQSFRRRGPRRTGTAELAVEVPPHEGSPPEAEITPDISDTESDIDTSTTRTSTETK